MNHFDSLYPQLEEMGLEQWARQLRETIPGEFSAARQGKMPEWQEAISGLPAIKPSVVELKERVVIGAAADLDESVRDDVITRLKALHPWRKGPIELFGIKIDTEWRSDWKWDRVLPHIQPLAGRRVLDVGCGNGYHGWRMRGEGAEFVLGVEPMMGYVMQFLIMQRYLADPSYHLLPMRMEDVPSGLNCFDTVFSMGVLYHRRSPIDHLLELKGCLNNGGELVLETLVVEGDINTVLVPKGRYAMMRNVWFIPSVAAMKLWLQRCGFKHVACVDVNQTSVEEQRRTEWMTDESLASFLDPHDSSKTVEGYPAPLRAIFTATK